MAEHLARIIGTEEDRVNCPFYWKIGACRHGDQCSRAHYKPTASQTLILRHMYQNPPVAVAIAEGQQVSDSLLDQAADHFEAFYSEVFEELTKYGEIEDMVACDNIGDHIIGNIYIKYANEDAAQNALKELSGRFYAGKQIEVEYTPVTDFREARCRQFVDGQCRRGGYCNFMHMKHVPRSLKRKLFHSMFANIAASQGKEPPNANAARSRSRGREREKDSSQRPGKRESVHGRDRDRDRNNPRDRDNRDRDSHRDRDRQRDRDRNMRQDRDNNRDRDGGYRGRDGYRDRERGDQEGHYNHNGTNNRSQNGDLGGDDGCRMARQSSVERRAMIASWNEERERGQGGEKEGDSSNGVNRHF